MGRYGASILTIAGAIIGAFTPIGPAFGALLGSLAGQLLFPPTQPNINGPRLNDITQTNSTVGAPIPRGWGTFPASGNIIAQTDLREVIVTEEVGGKGQPSQTTSTPTYYQDFAIGLNDGLIGGVRRIWANGKIIYDRAPQRSGESDTDFSARIAESSKLENSFTLYLGTETQDPDPTLEAFYGVGNISAFRGLAYIVFENWQNKPEDGNRMPSTWKFELYSSGASDANTDTQYSNEVLYPWITSNDPRDPRGTYLYADDNGSAGITDRSSFADAIADVGNRTGYTYLANAIACAFGFRLGAPVPYIDGAEADEGVYAWVHVNREEPTQAYGLVNDGSSIGNGYHLACGAVNALGLGLGEKFWWVGRGTSFPDPIHGAYDSPGLYLVQCGSVPAASPGWSVQQNGCTFIGCTPATAQVSAYLDAYIRITRAPQAPQNPCVLAGAVTLPEFPGYCVVDGALEKNEAWILDNSTTYKVLKKYATSGGVVTQYPLNPARPLGHADYNSEAFWTEAYEAAVALGDVPAGQVYGVDYPQTQAFGYKRSLDRSTITTNTVDLADVVTDIFEEAGFTADQLDVTDLVGTPVIGYVRTRVMQARAAIDPLRQAFWFDGFESAPGVKFKKRGGPVVRTFEREELGCAIQGTENPSRITTNKQQDQDLPRSVRVHYLSQARDYELGEQISPVRVDTDAVNDTDIELAVVMTDDQGLQVAQVLWADAWASRWNHTIVVDAENQDLEPTDCVAVPVDGEVLRTRIVSTVDTVPSLRKLEIVRDDNAAWTSYAVASEVPYVPQQLGFISPVEPIFLDLPPLRDADDDAGFYVALRPLISDAFKSAALYRSVDSEASFTQDGLFGNSAPVGRVVAPLGDGPTDIFDEAGELVVVMQNGTLSSRTREAVIGGANAAAVGVHGRWEIIQFRTVEDLGGNVFKLTGLLRGRRGTEHNIGTGLEDDRFVVVSDVGVVRVAMEIARRGAELQYRAVATGASLANAQTYPFTGDCEALKPFSPVNVNAVRGEDGVAIDITWTRRNRIGQEGQSGDIPMSEATESYEVEILARADDALLHLYTVTTNAATYSAADQLADLGDDSLAFYVKVYQISATVGRGYAGSFYPSVDLKVGGGTAAIGAADFVANAVASPLTILYHNSRFVLALKGTKGSVPCIGLYQWDGAAAPEAFADTYDSRGGTNFVPDSYFATINRALSDDLPKVAGNVDTKFSVYWRDQPGAIGAFKRFLLAGSAYSTRPGSVSPTDAPLSTSQLVAMCRYSGTTHALAAGNPAHAWSSTDGLSWTDSGACTGDLPALTNVEFIKVFAFNGATYALLPTGLYKNAANDFVHWEFQDVLFNASSFATWTYIDVVHNGDLGAIIIAKATPIAGVERNYIWTSNGGSPDWGITRNVIAATDYPAGYAFNLKWQFGVNLGTGFCVYGVSEFAGTFPYVLKSTDEGNTWTMSAVDLGDPTNNAVPYNMISSGSRLAAVDNARGDSANPLRFSTSTDGITFTAISGI